MSMLELVQRIVTTPTSQDLWELHPHLLALEAPEAEPVRELARMFYCYLSYVQSKLTSKQYSLLAATLSAGSVGMLAVHEVARGLASTNREEIIQDLLVGGLTEALETLATFQHVKAWETEFVSVHQEAVWHLYAALWQLSVDTQPDLPAEKRRMLTDTLLSYVRDDKLNSNVRMALIIRLYQLLLLIRLSLLSPVVDAEGK